jgi:phage-related protein
MTNKKTTVVKALFVPTPCKFLGKDYFLISEDRLVGEATIWDGDEYSPALVVDASDVAVL